MMMSLRKYQEDIVSEVLEAVRNRKRRILLMAPTGSGKTVMAHALLTMWLNKAKNCLFTCHRRKLVHQTFERFKKHNPSVMMGDDDRFNQFSSLQIASLYTIPNRDFVEPDVIIIDEVHYGYEANLIQGLLERFPKATVVGLSATPIDNKGFLLEGFDYYIDTVQMGDLIKGKYLVPPIYYSPVEIDLSGVKVTSYGDYEQSELEGVVIRRYLLNTAVENYRKFGEDRPFIGFAVSKKHGQAVRDAFVEAGIPVGYVDADTPELKRQAMDRDFIAGKLRGLISIEILTTGVDYPHCSCIVDMAPTLILRKFIQKGGRPARLFGDTFDESLFNGKTDFVYLDLCGAIKEHGLLEDKRIFKFKPKISKVIDRQMNIDDPENAEERGALTKTISKERFVYLQKIGKSLDVYDGRIYTKEADLMDDIRTFLKKTDLFWYRQNSGVAQYGYALSGEFARFARSNPIPPQTVSLFQKFIGMIKQSGKRFVRFTSVAGLADISAFYRLGGVFFGLEAKLKNGRLTPHQRKTFPTIIDSGILLFIVTSVYDVYEIICHLEKNILLNEEGDIIIKSGVYDLPDSQKKLYEKHRLELPTTPKHRQLF